MKIVENVGSCCKWWSENLQKKENWKRNFIVRWSALRVPGGNQVDGLPPARHTETVAKPGRLGPAQNDELTQNFIELARFCIVKYMKSPKISFRAYIEDGYRAHNIWKWQCHDQIYNIPKFWKISKNEEF